MTNFIIVINVDKQEVYGRSSKNRFQLGYSEPLKRGREEHLGKQ